MEIKNKLEKAIKLQQQGNLSEAKKTTPDTHSKNYPATRSFKFALKSKSLQR